MGTLVPGRYQCNGRVKSRRDDTTTRQEDNGDNQLAARKEQ